jgi:ubiquinone/menaquinone biosynthesis C-methylase UbiE
MNYESGSSRDLAYRVMVLLYRIYDLAFPGGRGMPRGFGIRKGQTVVDYGCGPGRYLREASGLVGPRGKVYAADVNDTGLRIARKEIEKRGLANVECVKIIEGRSSIPAHSADLVYALDMFHAVRDPKAFLTEIRRIVKKNGRLILEDGHQPRAATKWKLAESGLWRIDSETRRHVLCVPKR